MTCIDWRERESKGERRNPNSPSYLFPAAAAARSPFIAFSHPQRKKADFFSGRHKKSFVKVRGKKVKFSGEMIKRSEMLFDTFRGWSWGLNSSACGQSLLCFFATGVLKVIYTKWIFWKCPTFGGQNIMSYNSLQIRLNDTNIINLVYIIWIFYTKRPFNLLTVKKNHNS